jgi:tRNA (cytidine56-2'-O)-methyltransferase
MAEIIILRLGHRKSRDKRVTTHVFLAARALGARGGILCGERDDAVLESVRKVSAKWGGKFSVSYAASWRKAVASAKRRSFCVVHLTMYGMRLQERIGEARKKGKLLVIVGAEKVPAEVYGLADLNIAVTSQPHSEVAALAVFLHEYFGGRELGKRFPGARIAISPSEKGKSVRKK